MLRRIPLSHLGGSGSTLEDVTILTLGPVFGEGQVANLVASEGENKKRIDTLISFLSKLKMARTSRRTCRGRGNSRRRWTKQPVPTRCLLDLLGQLFVFLCPLEDGMHVFVFPMAMSLGNRLALVPWYFESLYARLDECSRNITQSGFRATPQMPCEFKAFEPQLVDGVERVKTSHPRSQG